MEGPSGAPLPRLRRELGIERTDDGGQPTWTVHDPVRARYFRLGWLEFELLVRLPIGDADAIVDSVNRETPLDATVDDLQALVALLEREELVQATGSRSRQRLAEHAARPRASLAARGFRLSMHARVTLLDPHRTLVVLTRLLRPVLDRPRATLACLAVLSLIAAGGLITHAHTFRDTLTTHLDADGMLLFALTLIVLNVVHEFGHGIVATRLGCRVHAMGVALIFLIPVAWCDTSDAWRLRSNRARLAIDAGGLAVEGAIALIATLAWLVLPDGAPRALAFFVAATSLATTCLINLNPFMKFDGYYLLADALGVDNLQERSFDALRVRIRRALYARGAARPDAVPGVSTRTLYAYAAATWIYRLFLYAAIAWAVYTFWFKALGVLLAGGVLFTLLVKPVWREIALFLTWRREHGTSGRAFVTLAIVASFLVVLCLPLPRAIDAAAMLVPAQEARILAPWPARIAVLHAGEGERVRRGDALVTLDDPLLEHDIARLTRQRAALAERRRGRLGQRLVEVPAAYRPARGAPYVNDGTNGRTNGGAAGDWAVDASDEALAEHDARLAEAEQRRDALTLRAPFDATVVHLEPTAIVGRWLGTNAVLAALATTDDARVNAYLPSHAVTRVLANADARFLPTGGGDAYPLSLIAIETNGVDRLVDAALAVPNGGPLAVRPATDVVRERASGNTDDVVTPIRDLHLASFRVPDADVLHQSIPGRVRLPGAPSSLAARAFDRLYGAVIRESGF